MERPVFRPAGSVDMRSRVVVLVLLAMAAAASAQVRPARAPAPLTGTATLTGVVVSDDADARPIRRVAVTLNAPGDPRRQWVTSTDDSGRFAFAGLPAGSFSLVAAASISATESPTRNSRSRMPASSCVRCADAGCCATD